MQERLPHHQDHGLWVGKIDVVLRHVGDAHKPRKDRPGEREGLPAERDPAGTLRVPGVAQRHEPHDDVWLPEVAEPPCQT